MAPPFCSPATTQKRCSRPKTRQQPCCRAATKNLRSDLQDFFIAQKSASLGWLPKGSLPWMRHSHCCPQRLLMNLAILHKSGVSMENLKLGAWICARLALSLPNLPLCCHSGSLRRADTVIPVDGAGGSAASITRTASRQPPPAAKLAQANSMELAPVAEVCLIH